MKILICPLDWGLGHATRCIPLIRVLQKHGHQVIVGAAGGGQRLLAAEFPGLEIFSFPGYRVRYSKSPAFFLPVMLMQLPSILDGLYREGFQLRRMVAERKPDLVISDGRYGVFTRVVPCIFVTHQIYLRVPGRIPGIAWVERLALKLNLALLRRFREVWVPDFPGSKSLSGDLSHGHTNSSDLSNVIFIGPLSRFGKDDGAQGESNAEIRADVLAMVSGLEPQRGLFEAALRRELEKMPGTRVLVRGLPDATDQNPSKIFSLRVGGLNEFNHLPGKTLATLLKDAGMVVARSGYTTVMEMAGMDVRAAVLVPTPGQTEQEYLADHLEQSATAMRMDQDELNLFWARENLGNYTGFGTWSATREGAVPFSLTEFISSHKLLHREPL